MHTNLSFEYLLRSYVLSHFFSNFKSRFFRDCSDLSCKVGGASIQRKKARTCTLHQKPPQCAILICFSFTPKTSKKLQITSFCYHSFLKTFRSFLLDMDSILKHNFTSHGFFSSFYLLFRRPQWCAITNSLLKIYLILFLLIQSWHKIRAAFIKCFCL